MTTAEKVLAVVREYDRLMTAIAQNKRDISKGLNACDRIVETDPLDGFGNVTYIPDGGKTCLAEAFEPRPDEDSYGGLAYNTPEEITEILSECPGCQKAYAAIQERKENRKKLGAVKRKLRMIGRMREVNP